MHYASTKIRYNFTVNYIKGLIQPTQHLPNISSEVEFFKWTSLFSIPQTYLFLTDTHNSQAKQTTSHTHIQPNSHVTYNQTYIHKIHVWTKSNNLTIISDKTTCAFLTDLALNSDKQHYIRHTHISQSTESYPRPLTHWQHWHLKLYTCLMSSFRPSGTNALY